MSPDIATWPRRRAEHGPSLKIAAIIKCNCIFSYKLHELIETVIFLIYFKHLEYSLKPTKDGQLMKLMKEGQTSEHDI